MLKYVPVMSIGIAPNRQRAVFDQASLVELAESIQHSAFGLLHPIVIRAGEGGPYLVAGERRLRAIKDIYDLGGHFNFNGMPVPEGCVPVVDLGDLPHLDAEEAELEENIRRVDLSWQERAEANSRMMALRQGQANRAGIPLPTVAELAKEVRPEFTYEAGLDITRKELIVSRFLDDPAVKAAPTLNEAMKVLKKREAAKQNESLAKEIGQTFTSSAHTLINVNGKVWCPGAAAESFDIILTDPPYGMGADGFGDSGVGTSAASHAYRDDYETWKECMGWFAPQSFRLAKANAHLYAFCDIDKFQEVKERLATAGWKVHRTPLIWSNPDGFRAPWPEQGPQRKYEFILYAVKGGMKTNAVRGDVLEYRKDPGVGYAPQKPVALLTDLLRRSARPGMSVFDPFGGSGSTLIAAHELKLTATVLEVLPEVFGMAAKRLKDLSNQKELAL